MNIIYKAGIFLIFWIASSNVFAYGDFVASSNVDFIHYKAELEPDFQAQSVSGKVHIEFVAKVKNIEQLTFSAKFKTIYSVKINNVTTSNHIEDERLIVTFKEPCR
jgi:aminopeptidase N